MSHFYNKKAPKGHPDKGSIAKGIRKSNKKGEENS